MRLPFAILLLLTAVLHAEPAPVKPEDLGYKLSWSDEFDGAKLDTAKWQTNYAPKVHPLGCNGELQSYAPENAALRDGKLILRAERQAREGMVTDGRGSAGSSRAGRCTARGRATPIRSASLLLVRPGLLPPTERPVHAAFSRWLDWAEPG